MEEISCPICNRDYELPKRYMINMDDFDFKPIPRMLSCLHTVCHSCLEEQREKSKKGKVVCPICKTKDVIKGVCYLPLDISALKQVVKTSGAGSMAVCSQCYDDVPSFSFCLTCSSSLCEFHHQDHRLSVNTTKHNIHTFKDIAYHGLHIDYNFPPVPCPEVPLQDCSLYCQDCLHLISAQAMIENHRDHQVEDFKALVPAMEESVNDSVVQSKQNCSELGKRIAGVQAKLRQLDRNEEDTAAEISRAFKLLHRRLETRERELLDRMDQIVQERRFMLTEQLSLLSDLNEDCAHAARVAEALLADTRDKVVEGMYLVATAEAVEFRSDSLNEQMEKKLKELVEVDPAVSVRFSPTDIGDVLTCMKSFGAIVFPGGESPDSKELDPQLQPTLLPKIKFTVTVR
jgi:chaperonin cofactor prefoldin